MRPWRKAILEADHIKPVSKYPLLKWDIDNLQPLCDLHNERKSNRQCADYRPGHIGWIWSALRGY
jgi:5-methylcytosine-specific restriction endonuclease McrA